MLYPPVVVPNIDTIKRHAKAIKRATGIQHARALDEAAVSAGFQNFRHAQNQLLVVGTPLSSPIGGSGYPQLLNVVWRDRKASTSGKESLVITLSRPLDSIIGKAQLSRGRILFGFTFDSLGQLTMWVGEGQDYAKALLCKAARTLVFMDVTGLRRSAGSSRAYPANEHRVPHEDHASIWYHPASKGYVIASEPYEAAMKGREAEVMAWCARHGYTVSKPNWPGMYNPQINDEGGSRLYLFSRTTKGAPIDEMASALNALSFPVTQSTLAQTMQGVDLAELQRSLAIAPKVKAKKPPRPAKAKSAVPASVGVRMFLSSTLRRPNARMPIVDHQEAGRLLKSVLQVSYYRKGVYNRINTIRCELDDWVQVEYPKEELSMEVFAELYYQERESNHVKSMAADKREKHISSLRDVQTILSRHYPDSAPLRAILKKIDAAIGSLASWK